jgi:hypothetical protein
MNAHAALFADPAPHDADVPVAAAIERARALARRQMAVLERLAEAGMQVILAVEREAKAAAPSASAAEDPSAPSDTPDPAFPPPPRGGRGRRADEAGREGRLQGLAMAYARAARGVRMTVMLQSRLMGELEEFERRSSSRLSNEARERLAAREAARRERKARVRSIVQRLAEQQWEAEGADAETLEALGLEGLDRLDEDVYGDVMERPMGEIVARICRDLGLDPDWSRLAQEAWAEAEAAAGAAGSPFVGDGHREFPSPSRGEGQGWGCAHNESG